MPSYTTARVIWACIVGAFVLAGVALAWQFWYVSLPLLTLFIFLVIRRQRAIKAAAADRARRMSEAPTRVDWKRLDPADHGGKLLAACLLIVEAQFGSSSMIQRRLGIDYGEAAILMDELQSYGVVGPSSGSKARDVLVAPADLDESLERIKAALSEPSN
jgi:hypothetical protein